MKIIHLCLSGPYTENLGYQENLIAKYNKKDGNDVTIIASRLRWNTNSGKVELVEPTEYINSNGVKVIRIDYKYKLFLTLNRKIRIYKNLYKIIKKENPDLIFMHGIQSFDMLNIVKYIKKNNCKLVADTHATYENSASNFLSKKILHGFFYKNIIKKSLQYIEKIFPIAPATKKFAIDIYGIPNNKFADNLFLGADTDKINFENQGLIRKEIRDELKLLESDFVLITGGKMNGDKNIETLLNVFKNIDDDEIKLIVFGVFTKDIKNKIMKLINENDNIKFIGWLNSEDIYNYYLASDLAVFPGSKSALWEQAIVCGLPIICRKWDGMDYVDVGGNCIYIDNQYKLKKGIELLKSDQNLYNKMSEIAKTKGHERFSYEHIAKKAIDIEK